MPVSDRHNVREECWDNCCCSPIGYVCCCRRMRRSSRIQLLWGWLLFISVGSSVILGTLVYNPDTPYATPADMRAVTKNFHPLFCEGVKISSPHLTFDAYLIQGDLTTDTVKKEPYESKSAFYVDAKQFYFFTFYLLVDSSVRMRHCPNELVTFYVFRGKDNFDWWKNDQYCEKCYIVKRYLNNCDTFNTTVEAEDEYFIVYSNAHETGTWVDLHVLQNRSIYDLGDASPVCSYVYSCEVAIYDLKQTAVYQVSRYYNLDDNSHPVFTTTCVPRIWSYVIIHGLICLFIGGILSFLIHKYCKDPQTNFTWASRSEERAPLLTSQLPPSYSTVVLTPPKYEDIAKDFDKDLPSYSDVLASSAHGQYNITNRISNPDQNQTSSVNNSGITQNSPVNRDVCENSTRGHSNSLNVHHNLTNAQERPFSDAHNGEHYRQNLSTENENHGRIVITADTHVTAQVDET